MTPGWEVDRSFTAVAQQATLTNVTPSRTRVRISPPERSMKTHLPGSPGIDTKRIHQRTAVYGSDARNIPPSKGGGESVMSITLGLGIDQSFTLKL